jgi:cytochrome c biogenesis protein CcmG, thiol:disulfide interchange protein DsbE
MREGRGKRGEGRVGAVPGASATPPPAPPPRRGRGGQRPVRGIRGPLSRLRERVARLSEPGEGRHYSSLLPLPSSLLFLLLLAGCDEIRGGGAVGDPAPEYAAVSLAGEPVSLQELRGNVVLMNVWATWCPPCRAEMPELQTLHERHADEGLVLVGVSIDARGERAQVQQFLRDHGITFPIWLDPDERVTSTFRTIGVPSTFLIDREGQVVWRHVGPITADDAALNERLREAL